MRRPLISISTLVILMTCSSACVFAAASLKQNEKGKNEILAEETVRLVRGCITSGMPPTFPKRWVSAYPDASKSYNSEQWAQAGRGFYDYVLLEDWNRALYNDLKKYWNHDAKERFEALPHVATLYLQEKDDNVKRLLTGVFYSFIGEVMPSHPDTSGLEKPILSMLESEVNDERAFGLYTSLEKVYCCTKPESTERLLSLVQKDAKRCRVAGQASQPILTLVCKESNAKLLADGVLELASGGPCEEMKITVVANASCIGKYAPTKMDETFNDWLPRALRPDAGSTTLAGVLLNYYSVRNPSKRVMPYLIMALESSDPILRCNVLTYLRILTDTPPDKLPYRESEATFYWEKLKGIREQEYVESVKKTFLKSHEEAIKYWKSWWAHNKAQYD